jgi:hypothetical protein
MWKARGVFGALLLCQCVTAIIGASAIALGAGSALAQEPSDDPNTTEGWAWPRIKRGEVADFNARCETPALNPRDDKDARWSDDCRKLSIDFLRDLLTTRAPWREAIPFAGIQIKGARIVGDVLDLENAKLIRSISILDSRIEAAIKLVRARTDSLIALDGSLMNGSFDAYGLHIDSDLSFNGTVFKNEVNLSGAKIDGSVDLAGAGVDGKLDASQARIGGYLSMNSDEQNKASFNEVDLVDAKVAGQLTMYGASFNGTLSASLLRVGGNLVAASVGQYRTRFQKVFLLSAEVAGSVMLAGVRFDDGLEAGSLRVGGELSMTGTPENKASFKKVDLTAAKVGGNVLMSGASFDGALEASLLQVGGIMGTKQSSFKGVNLTGAKVTGNIVMIGASFDGALNAEALQVGGDLLMNDGHYADKIVMVLVHVGRDLNLRGASLGDLDLSGASIAGALKLGRTQQATPEKSGTLDLRNAHAGNLEAAQEGAWPPNGQLRLAGFTFGHLGGDRGVEARKQKTGFWDNWLRLDPDYSPTPYTQLAAAFTSSGDRDAAEDIRYLGRERQREAACKDGLRGSCVLQTVLGSVAGYGIGSHTFVVVWWVLAFWVAGALLLWFTVPAAKHHGAVWCCCASLAQLLPVIRISKELTDFFDDPGRTRLKGWQVFVFSALGLVGFLLGGILLVAVSGLTHSS